MNSGQWGGPCEQHIISRGELILSHQSQGYVDLPWRCVASLFSCLDQDTHCEVSLAVRRSCFYTRK